MDATDSLNQPNQVGTYKITEKISETSNSIVFKGKDKNNKKVSIRVFKTADPSSSDLARFKQEYNLIKSIDLKGVIKTYDVIEYEDKPALVLEYCEGKTLKEALKNKVNNIKWFLNIAVKLSETLGKLHTKQIVHKDIKPSNILVFLDDIKLIDFGISKEITHENEQIYDNNVIEGTLPYMSPEQTGRMNRSVDYRTDLYSMGITFYEMLTGRLPFTSDDPMEIIHFHIAKEVEPPDRINRLVPGVVSEIVMKLLRKAVQERYQNSFGVLADLNRCLEEFNEKGQISDFQIAGKDISLKFNIPLMLIGREKELETLMNCFERVSRGAQEVMLVSGHPGIGKSALIHEVQRPIVEKKGYFISGKYDQFRRNVPHSSIIQAFKGLTGQILSESEERMGIWKEKLLAVLGNNGKIITNMISYVELIIGKQQDVPELGTEASQNRLIYVFKNFIKIFTSKDHPLVLFLDDIQWADTASLNLIKEIVQDRDIGHLLLIMAFRDNEIDKTHIVTSFLEEINSSNINISNIDVGYLDTKSTNMFISNFLRCDEETSLPIGELVHEKTRGNPFFVNHFMKSLYESGMIYHTGGGWEWNIADIRDMQVTENVVELLVAKINTLHEDTREVLKICSCIGNRFDLETIVQVAQIPIEKILTEIKKAIEEDLVSLRDNIYVFYHDRIQEAAYSLIPAEEREKRHYQIGNLILNSTEEEGLDKKIQYIVNQINSGRGMIKEEQEKLKAAELNLRCAKKSIDSAAYESAYQYIKIAIELAGKDCWAKDKDLSISIYITAVEAACLNSDFKMMEKYSNIVEKKVPEIIDRIKIYEIKMRAYTAQDKKVEAIKTASELFKGLKINLPESPNKFHLIKHLIKVKIALKKKSNEDILNLPAMTDPEAIAGLRMLMAYSSVAYWARPQAIPLIDFMGIELILKHGHTPESAYFFNGFGLICCALGHYDEGYNYGKLGLTLIEKYNKRNIEARIRFIFSAWVQHWKESQGRVRESLNEIHKIAMETGDFEFAANALMGDSILSFFSGMDIGSLEAFISPKVAIQADLRQESQENITRIILQALHNLSGRAEDPFKLIGEIYNEKEMVPIHEKAEDSLTLYYVNFYNLIVNFILKNYERAVESSELGLKYVSMVMKVTAAYLNFNFYDSLSRIKHYKNAPVKQKKKLLKVVLKNQKMLKKWTQEMETNFMHKYYLVEAELARLRRDITRAVELYEKAAEDACKNGYIQDEALAHELAAGYWMEQGNTQYASMHFTLSLKLYTRWGAKAKVDQMREEYPGLIKSVISSPTWTGPA
ncbi:MAG: serine/threonine-protein kinase PknK, partial [bacterium]|nr:serine/threonine-protein kinase PknK [bacterium]